jgi:hypothetical protein
MFLRAYVSLLVVLTVIKKPQAQTRQLFRGATRSSTGCIDADYQKGNHDAVASGHD